MTNTKETKLLELSAEVLLEKKRIIDITLEAAIDKIENTNGRFFGVTFEKRTDGTIRDMVARLGVHSSKYAPLVGAAGKGLGYDPKAKDLIGVYEMKVGYKSINIPGIKQIRDKGVTYQVTQSATVKDKYIKTIEKLTPEASAQDMADAYGNSNKNPKWLENAYFNADIERQQRKDGVITQ